MRQATEGDEILGGIIMFIALLSLIGMIIFIYVLATGILKIDGGLYGLLVLWLAITVIAFVAGHDLYSAGKAVRWKKENYPN